MDISAFTIYRTGENIYSIVEKDNGGPFVLGKQLVDEVPSDPAGFQAWKSSKLQHFGEEDLQPLRLPTANELDSGDCTDIPEEYYSVIPSSTQWVYIIDLDQNTFLVAIARYWTRVFCLDNLPRSLFESAVARSTTAYRMEDDYTIFLDPVSRIHLPSSDTAAEPDPVLLALYHTSSPKLRPSTPFPGVDTFSLRKHLRLVLLSIVFRKHVATFCRVNHIQDAYSTRGFHKLIYTIVNLARSSVEVRLQRDQCDKTPAESTRGRTAPRFLYDGLPTTPEYWIDGVLVILERDITTLEALHAAIGTAVRLTASRTTLPASPNTPSAIICSLSAIVLVYICGATVTHTATLNFFPQSPCCVGDRVDSEGVLALLATFYRPAGPAPPPHSFPAPRGKHLPTEICVDIFSHACPGTRTALEASCRLFRGIAVDYGIRVGKCYLQKRSAENGNTAFIGEIYGAGKKLVYGAGKGVWAGRDVYTRRTVVYLASGRMGIGPVYWAVLVLPDGEVVRLDLSPMKAKEQSATVMCSPGARFRAG